MARDSIDILELLHKRGMDGNMDFLCEAVTVLGNGIMDGEASVKAGAGYGERSPDRSPSATDTASGVGTREWV